MTPADVFLAFLLGWWALAAVIVWRERPRGPKPRPDFRYCR